MKIVYGYTRVSSDEQKKGYSPSAQQDLIQSYANNHDIRIVEWFEETQTAAKRGRPIFEKMMQQARQNKVDGVIVHRVDRSARNYFDWGAIGEFCDEGYDFIFAQENINYSTADGRIYADFLQVSATNYVPHLKRTIRTGIDRALQTGYYPGRAPLGYNNPGKGKIKTLDAKRAPLVKQLFELYATGQYTIRGLRDEMARRGLRTRGAERPLSKTGIERILRNPFYTGVIFVRASGKYFEGNHNPIITPELFEQVQQIKTRRYGKGQTRRNHLFRGLFRCAHCDTSMIGELQRGKVYYRCHTKGCVTKTVQEQVIHEAVIRFLKRFQLSNDDIKYLKSKLKERLTKHHSSKGSNITQMELARLEERLDRWTDKLADGVIDDETFKSKQSKMLMERQILKNKQRELSQSARKIANFSIFLEQLKNLYSYYCLAENNQKRTIVQYLTSNRYVSGKSLSLEPQNWLRAVMLGQSVSYCAPSADQLRSSPQFTNEAIDEILSEDFERFWNILNA